MAVPYNLEKSQSKFNPKLILRILVVGLIIGGLVAVLIRSVFYNPIRISTVSMEPTLNKDQVYFLNKWTKPYNLVLGDIVLCEREAGMVVGRILGKPSDTIAIDNKTIIRNGEILPPNLYPAVWKDDRPSLPIEFTNRDNLGAIRIPENNFFLIGDNRDESMDSRHFGTVPFQCILGTISP
ncbi:signal peptidase I [Leptospira sp. GIMC2001]|uniref:signal peptidase I n=1 Tax=Leptospira sp. GIMC2001 TaxID=1513297 RepID=UPI002349ACF4|nr:signal peptidase I [Leptospira sp. GIMC2001]WCL48294.1 signal peptidase I [Leptospira sp. GIMC2001]